MKKRGTSFKMEQICWRCRLHLLKASVKRQSRYIPKRTLIGLLMVMILLWSLVTQLPPIYRGKLEDRLVAVKTPQGLNGSEELIDSFFNEVTIKQQISHQNVLQLYGCCLETHIPMLVHELADGSLYDFLHGSNLCWLSWKNRLSIATEIAYALSYMHSAGPKPIVHRGVTSSRIFLDKSLSAKLSGFRLSIIIDPEEKTQEERVRGTLGYIDPEYVETGMVTEKCDVYSFGVLMVELLTGKYPPTMVKPDDDNNYFSSYMTRNCVVDIVDQRLLQEESVKTTIRQFAALTSVCVQDHGRKRPYMEEVVAKLRQMQKLLSC